VWTQQVLPGLLLPTGGLGSYLNDGAELYAAPAPFAHHNHFIFLYKLIIYSRVVIYDRNLFIIQATGPLALICQPALY
jgi:hypothetical protein